METLSPLISLSLGIVLIMIGAVWLHKVSKKDKRSHRFAAIAIPMIGAFFIWSSAASTLPVIVNDEVEVVQVGHNWIMSRVEFDNTRSCKIKDVSATIHYSDGANVTVKSLYLPKNKNKPSREYGYLILQGEENLRTAVDFYIIIKADCPFGYEVSATLEKVKIPDTFNNPPVN